MENIVTYQNGNVIVKLDLNDGTKERFTGDNDFRPEFPESVDMMISKYCSAGCEYCYADCSPHGHNADFSKYENLLRSLHPWTEVALNWNSMPHHGLYAFLLMLRELHVIANVTMRQDVFLKSINILKSYCDAKLIHGIGVSLQKATSDFVSKLKMFPNAVIHVINGVFNESDHTVLKNNGLKILVLGYKSKGRGVHYSKENESLIAKRQNWMKEELSSLDKQYKVVGFDNLAVEQLHIKEKIPRYIWDTYYAGDDGEFTLAVDLVDGTFSKNSMSEITYPIGNKTIDDIFSVIQKERGT